jgi:hypothetical protein
MRRLTRGSSRSALKSEPPVVAFHQFRHRWQDALLGSAALLGQAYSHNLWGLFNDPPGMISRPECPTVCRFILGVGITEPLPTGCAVYRRLDGASRIAR